MRRPRHRRRGFTLIEVIMATTIAVVLLGALYVAVDMQLRSAQISRDTIQDSTLERALMARMDADAVQVVGLSDPARYRFQAGLDKAEAAAKTPGGANSANAAATSSNTSATNTTASASSGTTTATTTASSSFGSGSSTTGSSGASSIVLPLGVMGDSQTLHLFISTLPREIYSSGASSNNTGAGDATPSVSDVRRVSYWLVGGDAPLGLARQEVSIATSDDALQNLPPDVDKETSFILADEVRTLQFQYWDGTNWQDNWDSTQLGPDGVTPLGSPLAVAVTVGLAPTQSGPPQADVPLRTFRHVLVIPTANGMTLQTAAASGTGTPATSSGATNSNSTTGGGASP